MLGEWTQGRSDYSLFLVDPFVIILPKYVEVSSYDENFFGLPHNQNISATSFFVLL